MGTQHIAVLADHRTDVVLTELNQNLWVDCHQGITDLGHQHINRIWNRLGVAGGIVGGSLRIGLT